MKIIPFSTLKDSEHKNMKPAIYCCKTIQTVSLKRKGLEYISPKTTKVSEGKWEKN
jgi:hypothetical protein